MRRFRYPLLAILSLLAATVLVRCSRLEFQNSVPAGGADEGVARDRRPKVQGVDLNDPIEAKVNDDAIVLTAAKNEWASFAVQVSDPPKPTKKSVTYCCGWGRPVAKAQATHRAREFFRRPDPADAGRCQSRGLRATHGSGRLQPDAPAHCCRSRWTKARSIWPMPAIPPTRPTHTRGREANPTSRCSSGSICASHPKRRREITRPTASCVGSDDPGNPLALGAGQAHRHDFVLPDERHMIMTSQLGWEDLKRLYPEQFETVTPRLINRTDPNYARDDQGARFDSSSWRSSIARRSPSRACSQPRNGPRGNRRSGLVRSRYRPRRRG